MAPAKPASWKDVRSSMTYGPVCPMDPTTTVNDEFEFPFHHNWGYTNENCLTLNVWTPGINDNKKRPVMVWFHGGGFTAGSYVELPSYDGENLSKKGDVVVVSINHRLNILGFLDLSAYGEKYKHSANTSILDIKAALDAHSIVAITDGLAVRFRYVRAAGLNPNFKKQSAATRALLCVARDGSAMAGSGTSTSRRRWRPSADSMPRVMSTSNAG
jgi:hypothetical protein